MEKQSSISKAVAEHKVACSFDLRKTFECGQCFRWHEKSDNKYVGVVKGRVLELTKEKRGVRIRQYGDAPLSRAELHTYFDFGTNYQAARREIIAHAKSLGDREAIRATRYCSGMRILTQDPFETLISFMISANNNIPKIKLTIQDLCEKLGNPIIALDGNQYYTFPAPEQIANNPEVVRTIRAIGYRDRGIVEAAEKIASGRFDLSQCLAEQSVFPEALHRLVSLYGVGEKVANCVMLFGLGHRNAFPIDTWVKKVLAQFYGVNKNFQAFIEKQFPVHAGLVQQYLFFYLREKTGT